MEGNEQEMRLHKQVRQGQPGLMRTSQNGNHIDGTVLRPIPGLLLHHIASSSSNLVDSCLDIYISFQ